MNQGHITFRKTNKMPNYNKFQDCWRFVFHYDNSRFYFETINNNLLCANDSFFDEVPVSQNLLTEECMTCNQKLDYSYFSQTSYYQINIKKLYDCFHGLLSFIFYYSLNKLNVEELTFHFSGGKFFKKIDQTNDYKYNILNIFDYENISKEFVVDPARNAFFGVTFKRIKVQPIAYAIRSGSIQTNPTHLVSFTFEGYDEETNKWDILDERANINDLIPSGGFNIFSVRSTTKSYSSFKIKQTTPGSNDYWGFSISAFDIHGNVSFCTKEINILNDNLITEKSNSLDMNYLDSSSSIDMADYIFF